MFGVLSIFGGTTEIQKEIIASGLGQQLVTRISTWPVLPVSHTMFGSDKKSELAL